MRQSALLAWRLPPRLRRCRMVCPEDAWTGLGIETSAAPATSANLKPSVLRRFRIAMPRDPLSSPGSTRHGLPTPSLDASAKPERYGPLKRRIELTVLPLVATRVSPCSSPGDRTSPRPGPVPTPAWSTQPEEDITDRRLPPLARLTGHSANSEKRSSEEGRTRSRRPGHFWPRSTRRRYAFVAANT